MNDDTTLLRRYALEGDENAFAEIVQRHVNLVWGAACRITQDPELAKDVSQTVFADLARKASKLPSSTIIAGWLYRSSTLAAHTAVRTNSRRARREELAMMQTPPSHDPESTAGQALQPYVDEALEALPEADRDAVLLRFFSGLNFTQIGAATGTSDDAAQKRVSRALEKLRGHFVRRGIDLSQGAVAAGLSLAAAHAAPPGIATLFATKAVATATSGTLIASLATMKTSFLIAGATAVAVVSTGFAAWEYSQVRSLRAENANLNTRLASDIVTEPIDGGGMLRNFAIDPSNKARRSFAPADTRETLEGKLSSHAASDPLDVTTDGDRTPASAARSADASTVYGMDPVLMQRYGLAPVRNNGPKKATAGNRARKDPATITMDPVLAQRYGLSPGYNQSGNAAPSDARRAMENRYGLPPGSLPAPTPTDSTTTDPNSPRTSKAE